MREVKGSTMKILDIPIGTKVKFKGKHGVCEEYAYGDCCKCILKDTPLCATVSVPCEAWYRADYKEVCFREVKEIIDDQDCQGKGDFMTYRGRLDGWETMSREERQEVIEQMQFINADGEAIGYLVGDYLVGKVIDSCDEYINLEWWMPVGAYEATEEPVTTYSDGKWYNPTNQERVDDWARRIAKKGD